MELSFLKFCRKYEPKGDDVRLRSKRTVIITFPNQSSDPMSRFFHLYCKFFLIKHKPWKDSVVQAWNGPIVDEDNELIDDDDNNPIAKQWYIARFNEFCDLPQVNVSELEMFNSDVARLRRIRAEYEVQYDEEEEVLGNTLERPEGWMDGYGSSGTTCKRFS